MVTLFFVETTYLDFLLQMISEHQTFQVYGM